MPNEDAQLCGPDRPREGGGDADGRVDPGAGDALNVAAAARDAEAVAGGRALGICEWFHHGDHERVRWAADVMRAAGVRHIRTGISWADFHRPDGPAFIEFVLQQLRGFEVLACVWCTPPSRSRNEQINGPPHRLEDFGDFIGQAIDLYGDRVAAWELWNEPNGRYYWDFANHDPQWEHFATMLAHAGRVTDGLGVTTCLGGLAPADPTFVELLRDRGALRHIHAVGVHGFPMLWGDETSVDTAGGSEIATLNPPVAWDQRWRWRGWADRIRSFAEVAEGRPIWITETGYATWPTTQGIDPHTMQSAALRDAAAAPSPRVYWYAWQDLHPDRASVEGFHTDETAYHFGLYDAQHQAKPALHVARPYFNPAPRTRP
jgi:CDP-paratose 2-epimerase